MHFISRIGLHNVPKSPINCFYITTHTYIGRMILIKKKFPVKIITYCLLFCQVSLRTILCHHCAHVFCHFEDDNASFSETSQREFRNADDQWRLLIRWLTFLFPIIVVASSCIIRYTSFYIRVKSAISRLLQQKMIMMNWREKWEYREALARA